MSSRTPGWIPQLYRSGTVPWNRQHIRTNNTCRCHGPKHDTHCYIYCNGAQTVVRGLQRVKGITLFSLSWLGDVQMALRPTQPPAECVQGVFTLGAKADEAWADRPSPSSAEIKNKWRLPLIPLYAFMTCTGTTSLTTDLKVNFKMWK